MAYHQAVREGRCRRFLAPPLEAAGADTPVCGAPVAGARAGWLGADYCPACLARLTVPAVRRIPAAARKARHSGG
jgi:hypothetical protein